MNSLNIPESDLRILSDWVSQHMGLHFPPNRWDDLSLGIAGAAEQFGFPDVLNCIRWLITAPLRDEQIKVLAGQLTIGETYFFREIATFKALEETVLPNLLRVRYEQDHSLRVWCAGCCTGEEPYSIAILLRQLLPDWPEWNITILGTDINPKFIEKARAGIYGSWSFRVTPESFKERYFRPHGEGAFELLPDLKKWVHFHYLNLVEDNYPSNYNFTLGMDVVFCRNVLMYFDGACQEKVVGKFHRSLRDGGWFIPGLTEILEVYRTKFTPVNFPGAVLYQKSPPVKSKPAISHHWIEEAPLTPLTPGREPACLEAPADAANRHSCLKPSPLSGSLHPGPALANPAVPPAVRSAEPANGEGTVESLVQRARSLAGGKNLAAAIHCLDRALAMDRLNIQAYYVQGMVFLELGELGRALKAFKHTLFLQPEHILAHVNLAQVAGRQNQFRLRDKHLDNATNLLKRLAPDAVVPEADGLSASHLLELITKPQAQELPGEPPK